MDLDGPANTDFFASRSLSEAANDKGARRFRVLHASLGPSPILAGAIYASFGVSS
jgi:hypothetical protein